MIALGVVEHCLELAALALCDLTIHSTRARYINCLYIQYTITPGSTRESRAVHTTSFQHHPNIWRFGQVPVSLNAGIATSFPSLDADLSGGWPRQLVELLCDPVGIGEVSLTLPAMAKQTQAKQVCAWVNAPYTPNAQALLACGAVLSLMWWVRARQDHDALWAAERLAGSGACGVVALWCRGTPGYPSLQRLSMAAQRGQCTVFLHRPSVARQLPSPAPLRLLLEPASGALKVTLLKRRGLAFAKAVSLSTAANRWPAENGASSDAARDQRIRQTEAAARRARFDVGRDLVRIPLVERRYPLPDR